MICIKIRFPATALLSFIFLLLGCKNNSEELLFGVTNCDTSNISFSVTIKNIIQNNRCLNCHSGQASIGGFPLESYSDVKAKVDDGRLWGAINHFSGFSPMPQDGGKLSDCDIKKIGAWINAGTPDN